MGCEPGGTACLCSKPDFQFGIHDCAVQACAADLVASVTNFATALCASKTSIPSLLSKKINPGIGYCLVDS